MKIEKSKYRGYLWYSNAKEPQILDNEEFELEISDDKNPFIIEGQLYDGEKSISIKYVDGEYIQKIYKMSEMKGSIQEQTFYSNRMKDKQLVFVQYWREESDELCEGMKVLQPKELVFVGFSKKEE